MQLANHNRPCTCIIEVYHLDQERRADIRREFLRFVFQSFYLIPYLTVLENVSLPLTTLKMKVQQKREVAERALERAGLKGKSNRLPSEISGGEQEMVAIVRSIANEPPNAGPWPQPNSV
jgi:putative ABC transport system ATP-binding protein